MTGHHGDEPCSDDGSGLADVVTGDGGHREHGQGTKDGGDGHHRPPHGVLGGREEGFEEHRQQSDRPDEQGWTRVDATERVEAICVKDKVRVLHHDVVHNALHVPWVRTAGQVPIAGAVPVHGGNDVPLAADDEGHQESRRDHDLRPVCGPEGTGPTWRVIGTVGPTAPRFVGGDGVDGEPDEERDAEPNHSAPGAVEIVVGPHAHLKGRRNKVQHPHRGEGHRTGQPALRDHAGHGERDDAGQHRCPYREVAVVAFDAAQGEAVMEFNAVELHQRERMGGDPGQKTKLQGQAVAVPRAVEIGQVPEPALAGLAQHATCQHGDQRTEHGEHDPDVEEDEPEGLSVFVERRGGLPFEGVLCGHKATGAGGRCGDQAEQQADARKDDDGRPLCALRRHQDVSADKVDGEEQADKCANASGGKRDQAEGCTGDDRPEREGGRRRGDDLALSEEARHAAKHGTHGHNQQRVHVVLESEAEASDLVGEHRQKDGNRRKKQAEQRL